MARTTTAGRVHDTEINCGQSVRSQAVSRHTPRPTIVFGGTRAVSGTVRMRRPADACIKSAATTRACTIGWRTGRTTSPPGPAPSPSKHGLTRTAGEFQFAVGAGKRAIEERVAVRRALVARPEILEAPRRGRSRAGEHEEDRQRDRDAPHEFPEVTGHTDSFGQDGETRDLAADRCPASFHRFAGDTRRHL